MNLSDEQTQRLLTGGSLSVVFWDLECTNLSAMIGRVLCCSFKEQDGSVVTLRGDDRKYRGSDIVDDSLLVEAIRDRLEGYDVIVGHNSKLFDAKFLEGRLFRAGLRPRRKALHVDTMWAIRSNLRVSSKLDNIQQLAPGVEDKKTPITWDDWARAGAWDKHGMEKVVSHCEQDVVVLEGVYKTLVPYLGKVVRG
jgi:uncharacterized protein YprB with RNaseH-like and TPR domain